MEVFALCGKGGVGKTLCAVSLALALARRGEKTILVDYDGGHSVPRTLGLKDGPSFNIVHEVKQDLDIFILQNSDYTSIAESKRRGERLEQYLAQFPADFGIIPLADMLDEFFGVPIDLPTLQKFITLATALSELEMAAYDNVILDVEPTAGLQRLLTHARITARSIRRLQQVGRIRLALLTTVVGTRWPDIAGYLGSDYIREADVYAERIERAVETLQRATYLLVCTPESGPLYQMFEIQDIIERFGGAVRGYIVNNVRGEAYEEPNIALLDDKRLPVVRIPRKNELHAGAHDPVPILLDIGGYVARLIR